VNRGRFENPELDDGDVGSYGHGTNLAEKERSRREVARGTLIPVNDNASVSRRIANQFGRIAGPAGAGDRLGGGNVTGTMTRLRMSRSIVAESGGIKQVLAQVEQVAPTPATVLLLGETGAGKDVLAQAIHDLSPRRHRPMIRVSCGAIPTSLIESELFGREKGAYTDALSRQIGRFEAAHQSTLFLDEIGELALDVQVKLLRVLEERVIERLGSTQSLKIDVRIIAATNRNLDESVRDRTFREDLFYRLNVFPVVVPPLRERPEDVVPLVWSFIHEFSTAYGKVITSISSESQRELQRYSWPGNVRELRNLVERAMIVASGPELVIEVPQHRERGVASNGHDPDRTREQPHPRRSQDHRPARSRIGRCGGASGALSHNARKPDD
jgi:transcriptional regulator with GAF, ATPase, and Fis domain